MYVGVNTGSTPSAARNGRGSSSDKSDDIGRVKIRIHVKARTTRERI